MKKLFAWDDKKTFKNLVKSTPALWLFAAVFYGLLTTMLMGTAITACSTTVFGYPGDGSGGIGWLQWADPGIRWNFTEMSNFPFGEALNRPQFITSYALFIPFAIFSLLTNQVCGQNIMLFIGFVSTALVTFGLVKWLTKQWLVALFAGFAAAFVPYHYFQAQGHQAYIFSVIFAAIIWAFLWFMQKPNVKRVVLVAVLYAFSLYMDGYFVLLSTLLVVTMVAVFLLRGTLPTKKSGDARWIRFDYKKLWAKIVTFRWALIAAIAVSGLLLVPIAYKQLKSGGEIQQSLSGQRSAIEVEAQTYGTYLEDFVLPSPHSIFVNDQYTDWRNKNIHGSNAQENVLYIGFVILALMIFVLVYAFTKKGRQDTYLKGFKTPLVVCAWIIVILTLFSLPPQLQLGPLTIPAPSQLLIDVTEKWRVLSRLFMITHVAMVVIAAIGLAVLVKKLPRNKGYWLVGLAFVVLAVEYVPVRQFNWSYITNTPQLYHEMAKDDSIKAVAEYPVQDHPSSTLPYTFTFQQTHGKPALNANGVLNNQHYLRQSIAGIGDPQTMGVLRQLGIDTVTSLGVRMDDVPGLRQYRSPEFTNALGYIYSFRVEDGPKAPFALVMRDGFTMQLDKKTQHHARGYVINSATMMIEPVGKNIETKPDDVFTVRFTANAHEDGAQKLTVRKNDQFGEVLWQGVVQSGTPVEFQVKGTSPLFLNVPGYYNTPALYIDNYSVTRN